MSSSSNVKGRVFVTFVDDVGLQGMAGGSARSLRVASLSPAEDLSMSSQATQDAVGISSQVLLSAYSLKSSDCMRIPDFDRCSYA